MALLRAHRLIETTGASFSDIAKAYIVSRDVFRITEFNAYIQQQDNVLPARFSSRTPWQYDATGATWYTLVFAQSAGKFESAKRSAGFRQGLDNISAIVADVVEGNSRQDWLVRKQDFVARGVAEVWAERLATPDNLFSGLGVVEAALQANVSNMEAAEIFYALLDRLNLSWFAAQLTDVKVESYWQAIARESFIDDLGNQLRKLTITLVQTRKQNGTDVRESVDAWEAKHRFLVDRWKSMLEEVLGTQVTDYAMFSVALKELIDLAETTSLS